LVGTDEAGEHLAGLYSLIGEVDGVNPVAYLADLLLRTDAPCLADRRTAPPQLEAATAQAADLSRPAANSRKTERL
jgi:hypothetical protein